MFIQEEALDSSFPPTKLREGNVYTRVCLFTGGGGPYVIITHDALVLTVHALHAGVPSCPLDIRHGTLLAPRHQTWDQPPTPMPLLVISGGHHWRPVQICSLEDTPHPPPPARWQAGGTHPTGMLPCFYVLLIPMHAI